MFLTDLAGTGLVLTAPTPSDIDRIAKCCTDPAIGRWTTMPVPYTRSDAEAFVRKVVPVGWADRSPTWAVRRTAAGAVLGMIGLGARDSSAAEVGFWLAPEARGEGIITRALNLVCDFGFRVDALALERIEWRAFVGNSASAEVARRVGFRFEGTARSGGLQRGTRRDMWVAALLPDDPREPAVGWPD
ncbi:Acetyltransferase [Rhodococcus sp. RD6.2]|uniref:GNAT family N-acetyltransferase n=1 Tax=Rhodococcus sp. RD6.2 TaxID=260936 RepID=UPI00063B72F9|nr:GNAT family N-acetyltransferase [Rhodococcus sp. RD6.2]CRK53598.1 Acetyltransferase [Rhodococcus sp. RD6.2]